MKERINERKKEETLRSGFNKKQQKEYKQRKTDEIFRSGAYKKTERTIETEKERKAMGE